MAQAFWAQVCHSSSQRSQADLHQETMSAPVRLAHGWAIAWLDFYQTPAIVTEGTVSEVKGFFRELTRGKGVYPHNHVNPQTAEVNRLGRPKQYAATDDGFPFAGCS